MTQTVSIAITTLNRRDDLQATLTELRRLDPAPMEILVCLDGCTDGSREMLEAFPEVTVFENETSQGSVFSRDRLFRAAKGDWIVSIDDDSYPVQDDFVSRLTGLAEEHPEAGVICFEEMRLEGQDDRIYRAPEDSRYVASYPNCAGAVRASLYGDQAWYPTYFFHAYEEPDYCLQTYGAGYGVLYAPQIKILHRYTSVGRNMLRTHHRHSRNELLSVIMRCPFPHVFWVATYRVARQAVYAASEGPSWLIKEPAWWYQAIKRIPEALRQRRPIKWSTYWAWMRLARNPLPGNRKALAERFPLAIEETQSK